MTAGIGDNSSHRVKPAQLRSLCERIERLLDEISVLREDVKEVKTEAKGHGYDVKVLNALLKHRAADKAELAEFQAMLDLYIDNAG